MMDTLSTPNAPADEILRLKCPSCGGGLNLKRRFLGVKGQCVHCQIPLTAVEENGVARVVTEAPEPFAFPPAAATHAAPPHFPEAPAPAPAPAPAATDTATPLPGSTWGFPDFHSSPGSAPAPIPASPAAEAPSFRHFATPELAPPLPSREGDDLFMGKHDLPPATPPTGEAKAIPSPFGESGGFSLSSPLFGGEDPANSVTPAWGTSVPRENHASISPFATGSAEGGGYAESLFREKVVKDAAADAHEPGAFATKMAPAFSPGMDAPSPASPGRDCQEFVILDGDGRPMKAMSKEEEEEFAKNFFKYDNARTKPTWVTRLRKKIIRMLVFFCVIGAIGAGASFFVPKETLLVWKEKAIKWLEPGMAILDYLPAGLRPDWLPQTDFGIHTGVDENGQPKKKMNAFEGLDKLKGDIGDMRGAADEQLEELKNF